MGTQIIRISRWSCRSLFLAYSRFMTLIFALFCAATGQLPKSASIKRAEATQTIFKGTIYRASDSTTLGGIRLFLTECLAPLYGIFPDYGIFPEYGVITPLYGVESSALPKMKTSVTTGDTIVTDENGNFEATLSGLGSRDVSLIPEILEPPIGTTVYAAYTFTECIHIAEGTDSTYTLYLKEITTAVKQVSPVSKPSVLTTYQGKILQVHIPEWHGKSGNASIVNSRGQEVVSINSTPNGTFSWNTRTVAKGVYFFRAHNHQTRLSVRILVK